MRVVAAPGKALLIGEYAVLDGAPAVVAAVGCYARAVLRPSGEAPPASPFIRRAVELTAQALGAPAPGTPVVDTGAFARDGRKLGLGSSAAATVAAVGALCAAAGRDLTDPDTRLLVHRLAAQAHDEAQGVRGSGADILAACHGGVRALPGPAGEPGAALRLPLTPVLVATSQAASTADLVRRYRERGPVVEPAREAMAQAAAAFLAAAQAGDARQLLQAVQGAYEAFLALQALLGLTLVTEEHRAVAQAARALGGAAKPSGAGGGDLAVVFLPSDVALERLTLPPTCAVLPYVIGVPGVRAQDDDPAETSR